MKRFRFSLQTLLQVKKQRERLAEAQVAAARKGVEACQDNLKRLETALVQVADRMVSWMAGGAPTETWAGAFDQSGRLERAIRDATAELLRAEGILQQAIQARMRLSTEVEALDILRQEHWDLYKLESQRAEQGRLDELGMRAWAKSQEDGQ